ncbi:MAG: hypothetical protein ABIN95_05745 [Mucilaginibacter sp.]
MIVILAFSCKKRVGTGKCDENIACTEIFASVAVKFVDKNGEGINVNNYSAVNQRTKDTIKTSAGIALDLVPGYYFVVDDSYTKNLSEAGDDIKVSGTNTLTNQTKTAVIKVSGGKCACHVNKVSGPEEIKFD